MFECFAIPPEVYGEMGAIKCSANSGDSTTVRKLLELTLGPVDPKSYTAEYLAPRFPEDIKSDIDHIVVDELSSDGDIVNDMRTCGYADCMDTFISDYVFANEFALCKGVLTTSMLPDSERKQHALDILHRHGKNLVSRINLYLSERKAPYEAFLGGDCIEILPIGISKNETVRKIIENEKDNFIISIGDSAKLKGDIQMALSAKRCGAKTVVHFCSGDQKAFFAECSESLRGTGIITVTTGRKFDTVRCDPLDKSTLVSIEMLTRVNEAVVDSNTPWGTVEKNLDGFTITHWR